MKRLTWIALSTAIALAGAGCILTSGRSSSTSISRTFASSPTNIIGETVDLNEEEDDTDHKDDIQNVANLAVLGVIKNETGSSPIDIEVWITPDSTAYADADDLTADPAAKRLWGPFALAAGATTQIDWDDSAALFKDDGKAVLLGKVKGDGTFTVYAIGTQGTYAFSVDNGVLVLTIDVGI